MRNRSREAIGTAITITGVCTAIYTLNSSINPVWLVIGAATAGLGAWQFPRTWQKTSN